MTSNVGSRFLLEAGTAGIKSDEIDQGIEQALKEAFRPEFLNRIDEIITFHGLTREHIVDIAAIQIAALNRRLAARELWVQVDKGAMAYLAQKGYDPGFGARPLKRVIQQEIENPLSMAILKGDFHNGDKIQFSLDETGKKLKLNR